MKHLFKRIINLDKKTEVEQAAIFEKLDFLRYRLCYFASYAVCLLPIPVGLLLRASLSDKEQINGHRYGRTYSNLFWKMKYRPMKLLEIGIGGENRRLGGQSLNAWQAFFPFGRIVACDIRNKHRLATPRTLIYQLDQSSKEQLASLVQKEGEFDIIIDDGSHLNAHQVFTFENLYPALRRGGIYVIEDVQTSYWSFDYWDGAPVNSPEFSGTCVGYFLNLTKYINHAEFTTRKGVDEDMTKLAATVKQVMFEHNLIIVIKGS
jgi:hypothetical protein